MTDHQTPTPEDVQQTLQAYLTAATHTGELRGTRVEFTTDGHEWAELLILADGEHPIAARATVHRAGWETTTVPEAWGEVVPAEPAWRALWEARPHVLFGAHALRTALRRAFADVLGARREPDDLPTGVPEPPAAAAEHDAAPVETVDYPSLVQAASTFDELTEVRRKARAARAMDLDLKKALDKRRAELDQAAPAPDPEPSAAERPARKTRRKGRPALKPDAVHANAPETSMAAAMREALKKHDEASHER